jgi:hypothetical protein
MKQLQKSATSEFADFILNSGVIQQSSANLSNNLGSTNITDLIVSISVLLPFQTFYDQVFNTKNMFYQENNFNNVNISNFLEISNTDFIDTTSFSVLGRAEINRCTITELTVATNLIVNGSITNTQLTSDHNKVYTNINHSMVFDNGFFYKSTFFYEILFLAKFSYEK